MEHFYTALHEWTARLPGSIALASRTGYMTYEDFAGNIASAASAAARNGIKPGQLVVLTGANQDAQLIIALALMRIGCRVGYTKEVGLYESSGIAIDAVIADTPIAGSKHRVLAIGRDWFKGAAGAKLDLPPPAADYSLIFSSSGSTGRPKLIEAGPKAVDHWLSEEISDSNLRDQPRFLSALGNRTMVHFYYSLTALAHGGMVIAPTDRQGRSVLDTIQLFRPDYVLMPPSTIVEALHHLDENPMAIDKVRFLRTAGAYCAPTLQQAALDRLTETFISNYGATETGRIAWGYSEDVAKIERCVGRLVETVEVAAFDSDNRQLAPGMEGEIRVKLPEGAAGIYIGDGSGQFQGFKDGWFVPGDIGLVDEDRNMIIRGRTSNVINTGGSKISPEIIEDEIRSFSQVRDVGVAGIERVEGFDDICAAIVSPSKPTLADINAHLHRRNALWPVNRIKRVPAIPKTDSGKIDRVALKKLCTDAD